MWFDRLIIACLGVLLLGGAAACSRPATDEQYVFDDGSGQFDFDLDLSDSLCVYDLFFYTRLESRLAPPGFPVRVYLTSPSGERYSESLFYDASASLVVPYRTDLEPVEYGLWQLSVRARAEGLKGLGLICTRKY
ncbi:MAG: hypothetical protein IJ654_03940 [Bacteroidales bacterium]|nr:hypothetical protein [Bacteroidales bacterium]